MAYPQAFPPPPDGSYTRRVPPAAPSISVCIPAYQAEKFVAAAIDSALAQEPAPFEVLVCDDGSTDDTSGVVAAYGDRVRLLRQANGGEAAARNALWRAARGEYVAYLDADDVYLPGRLAAVQALLVADPALDLVTTDAYITVDGEVVGRRYEGDQQFATTDQRRAILRSNFVFGHAVVRRALLEELGGYDPDIHHATDWEMWVRMVLHGARLGLVPEPLAEYRLHVNAMSVQRLRMSHGRVLILEKTLRRDDLSPTERSEATTALARERRRYEREALLHALGPSAKGGPDATRAAARAVLSGDGHGPKLRVVALAALAAPGAARRLVPSSDTPRGPGDRPVHATVPRPLTAAARRPADVRFLLPALPERLLGLGAGVESFVDAARRCDLAIVTDPIDADTVVCAAEALDDALATGAPQVLVLAPLGVRARRLARAAGYVPRTVHAWGGERGTRYFVPATPRAAGRSFLRARPATTARARVRMLALRAVVESGLPAGGRAVTVCSRTDLPPALARAGGSVTAGLVPHLLDCGDGDDLQRLVLHLADRRGVRCVCKFSRVPDNDGPFARDEAAAARVAAIGLPEPHAPQVLARGSLARTEYVIETFAPGVALSRLLDASPPAWVAACGSGIVAWCEALAIGSLGAPHPEVATAGVERAPDAHREHLRRVAGAAPTSFAHNDLGTWNILATPDGFTVVDWEGAAPAPPLWDLWYFVADLEGRLAAPDVAGRAAAAVDLFAGRGPGSAALFAATRRVATAAGIAPDDVGPLLYLCWLTHAARRGVRTDAVTALGGENAALDHLALLGDRWLADPALGVTWPAYVNATASGAPAPPRSGDTGPRTSGPSPRP